MSPKYASVVPDSVQMNLKLSSAKKADGAQRYLPSGSSLMTKFELPFSPEESKDQNTAKYLGSRKDK